MSEVNLEDLVAQCGCQFYDCELANENGRAIWRVYITKKSGVNLDDCERVSKLLSPIYDVMPPVSGEWNLEVSSPGLERKLSKIEHFAKSIGELVKITLNDKSEFSGKIVSAEVNSDKITIKTDDDEKQIEFSDIKKAKTFIIW